MSDLQPHNNRMWDRFFDLLYACDETVSDAEVDADLQRAKIDMRPAYGRLHLMIEQKKAQALLAKAREDRTSILEKLREVVAPKVDDLRQGVKDLIDRLFAGPELLAHHHKLEKAATEDDLKSLMDDLSKLAALRKQQDKDDPTAK
jgi:hypothetical protein